MERKLRHKEKELNSLWACGGPLSSSSGSQESPTPSNRCLHDLFQVLGASSTQKLPKSPSEVQGKAKPSQNIMPAPFQIPSAWPQIFLARLHGTGDPSGNQLKVPKEVRKADRSHFPTCCCSWNRDAECYFMWSWRAFIYCHWVVKTTNYILLICCSFVFPQQHAPLLS